MGYRNSGEPYGTRLYYKQELEKLQGEFNSMERQKNYWWRVAGVRGDALRQINKRTNKESRIHEIIKKALGYKPPDELAVSL